MFLFLHEMGGGGTGLLKNKKFNQKNLIKKFIFNNNMKIFYGTKNNFILDFRKSLNREITLSR